MPALPVIWFFIKSNWKPLAIGGAVLAAIIALSLYGNGREKKGALKEQVKTEQVHTAALNDVRTDEQLAQKVSEAVNAKLAKQQAARAAQAAANQKELDNAIAELSRTPAPQRRAVLDRVRAASNARVDRAIRAATYTGPAD